jgi:hypothetical protein
MSLRVGRKARFPFGDGVRRLLGVLVVDESKEFRNGEFVEWSFASPE